MVAAGRLAVLLLLGCVGLLQPAGARYIDYCPDGWSYYKLNCFKYFPDVRTWDEAEDPQEAATLRKSISYYQRVQSVWVGLRYKKE
ncbi:PREDICTED: regenerating islet-derived protein 4, partial [Acanthisitta chloris]|uniref:regenerating islet-derived protein 4 n=1 Tax=Acanthisitta chloris TaxID=57068 RepID=UPI0004F0E276